MSGVRQKSAAFAQFNAIARSDVADNIAFSKAKLEMPVLAISGEKSFGDNMAIVMRNAATNVRAPDTRRRHHRFP